MRNENQCRALMDMFNLLNVQYLVQFLSRDVVYNDYRVLATIQGYEEVLNYLTNKLREMQESIQTGNFSCYAELENSTTNPEEFLVCLNFQAEGNTGKTLFKIDINEVTSQITEIQIIEDKEFKFFKSN
jgi:hypothetical protein